MHLSLLQFEISWENRDENLEKLDILIRNVPGFTDLLILPEMFNTGFSVNAPALAETTDGKTVRWMKNKAREINTAICGSILIEENGKRFNRFIFIQPDGQMVHYDKRHLFSISGEDQHFEKGVSRVTFNYLGFRILPVICYDLRFPVWMRNRNDYDLVVCVANWPSPRKEVWKTLMKARAIENQSYLAGVNRLGSDPEGNEYSGDSAVIGFKGEIISSPLRGSGNIITAEISRADLETFREKFPVWKDADDFELKIR